MLEKVPHQGTKAICMGKISGVSVARCFKRTSDRPSKKLKPASGTRFTDWIGGVRYAGYLADLVPCPLDPFGTAPIAERRTSTELPTPLRWTRMMFLMIFESSGRRHGPIG